MNEQDILSKATSQLTRLLELLDSTKVRYKIQDLQEEAQMLFGLEGLPEIERVVIPSYNIEKVKIIIVEQIVDFSLMLQQNDVAFTATEAITALYSKVESGDVAVEIMCSIKAVIPEDDKLILRQLGKIQWHYPAPGSAYEAFAC